MSKKTVVPMIALMTALAAGAPALAADQPMVFDIKRLSMETALRMAQATIAKCRAEGVQAAVTIVDRGGNAQVMLRDVLAPDLTISLSEKKAYTAMSFSVATSALEGRFTDPNSVAKHERLVISGGGLPIEAGGTFYGGIGVSGAPTGELDEKCARAGIQAVQADLEMGG